MSHLKNNINYGLLLDDLLDNAKFFFGYVDVDYRQYLDRRISTTRYVFTLGGGSISCKNV